MMINSIKIYSTLAFLIFTLINSINAERHPECGESPTIKYKNLAKAIGKPL